MSGPGGSRSRRSRRATKYRYPSKSPNPPLSGTVCPECGKARFASRAQAQQAIRNRQLPAGRLRVYKCGDYFHLTSVDAEKSAQIRESSAVEQRRCARCNQLFDVTHEQQKYCGRACKRAAKQKRQRERSGLWEPNCVDDKVGCEMQIWGIERPGEPVWPETVGINGG